MRLPDSGRPDRSCRAVQRGLALGPIFSQQVFARGRENQLPVLDPTEAHNLVGKAFQFTSLPFHDDDFQAIAVIEMNVCGRKDRTGGVVLRLDQLLGKVRPMVVIDHRQGSRNHLVLFRLLLDKMLPNEIADCF